MKKNSLKVNWSNCLSKPSFNDVFSLHIKWPHNFCNQFMLICTSLSCFPNLNSLQHAFGVSVVSHSCQPSTELIVCLGTSLGNTHLSPPLTQFRISFYTWVDSLVRREIYCICVSLLLFISDIWVNFLPTGRGHENRYQVRIIHHTFPVLRERTALVEENLMNRGHAGPLALS